MSRFGRLFYLANRAGLDEEGVRQVVWDVVKKSSLKELSSAEQREVEGVLMRYSPTQAPPKRDYPKEEDNCTAMRKKVCWLLHELGKEKPDGRIDWAWFNSFQASKHSKVKKAKLLQDYTAKELMDTINQLNQLRHKAIDQKAQGAVNELKEELGL